MDQSTQTTLTCVNKRIVVNNSPLNYPKCYICEEEIKKSTEIGKIRADIYTHLERWTSDIVKNFLDYYKFCKTCYETYIYAQYSEYISNFYSNYGLSKEYHDSIVVARDIIYRGEKDPESRKLKILRKYFGKENISYNELIELSGHNVKPLSYQIIYYNSNKYGFDSEEFIESVRKCVSGYFAKIISISTEAKIVHHNTQNLEFSECITPEEETCHECQVSTDRRRTRDFD